MPEKRSINRSSCADNCDRLVAVECRRTVGYDTRASNRASDRNKDVPRLDLRTLQCLMGFLVDEERILCVVHASTLDVLHTKEGNSGIRKIEAQSRRGRPFSDQLAVIR